MSQMSKIKARRETQGVLCALLCLAGLGCQAPEPGPRRLLDVLQPVALDRPAATEKPKRLLVGPSERQALVTDRAALQAELTLPSQPILRFSVAPGMPPENDVEGTAEVTVSWIARGETRRRGTGAGDSGATPLTTGSSLTTRLTGVVPETSSASGSVTRS